MVSIAFLGMEAQPEYAHQPNPQWPECARTDKKPKITILGTNMRAILSNILNSNTPLTVNS